MILTPTTLASRLDGRQYLHEITKAEEAEAAAAGLVVVFGHSDDYVELHGAISDEIGAYDEKEFRVCTDGMLPPWPADYAEGWSEDEAEHYFRRKAAGFATIKVRFCAEDDGPFWTFETQIPHATFVVKEDGEQDACRGIVFSLSDVGATIK